MKAVATLQADDAVAFPILVVDDQADVVDVIVRQLNGATLKDGLAIRISAVSDTDQCLSAMRSTQPRIVIVDLELDKESRSTAKARDLIRRLSSEWNCGIIVYSVRADEVDAVDSLNIGADDYIHKPASPAVLVSRIGALARRLAETESFLSYRIRLKTGEFRLGKWVFSIHSRLMTAEDEVSKLSLTEFELLKAFVSSPSRSISAEAFSVFVLGRDYDEKDRRFDNAVHRLRQKLGPSVSINNRRGVGYQLSSSE